jgi:hypothetical protein
MRAGITASSAPGGRLLLPCMRCEPGSCPTPGVSGARGLLPRGSTGWPTANDPAARGCLPQRSWLRPWRSPASYPATRGCRLGAGAFLRCATSCSTGLVDAVSTTTGRGPVTAGRVAQAELLSDPLGWPVVRVDDGDEPVDSQHVASVVAAGCRGFGGQATTLERRPNVVADLDLGHAVDLLGGQAAVADELPAVAQRQQPQPKAALAVQPLVPLDPGQRLVAAAHTRPRPPTVGSS